MCSHRGWTGRPTLSTTAAAPGAPVCFCFFPAADKVASEFSQQLAASFKSAAVLGNNRDNIHLVVTCKDLDQFDADTKNFGSVNVWADVGGTAAAQFGVRPTLEVVDVADIFGSSGGTGGSKRRYAPQTVPAVFFALDGKIIKSPAMQPKYQTVMLSHIKATYDAVTASPSTATAPDSYGADMTREGIQSTLRPCWDAYLAEEQQMKEDLGRHATKFGPAQSTAPAESAGRAAAAAAAAKRPPAAPATGTATGGAAAATAAAARTRAADVGAPPRLRPVQAPAERRATRGAAPAAGSGLTKAEDETIGPRGVRQAVALTQRARPEMAARGIRAAPAPMPGPGTATRRPAAGTEPRARL